MSEQSASPKIESRLSHLPISLFATVMGLAGLTIATAKMEHQLGVDASASLFLLGVSALVYASVFIAYLTKLIQFPHAVGHEFNHPIRLSFFPASSIGLILLSIAVLPHAANVAFWLWSIGSVVQLLFTLIILSTWMHHERFQVQHSNPAWFIPIVGNILVPIAGVQLGYEEVSWFFYSIGLIMWLPLFGVLLNRFFFHPMLPSKLVPTLFIMIAPPAIGFVSWMSLHHGVLDDVGRILYYFALFVTLLMLTQVKHFMKVSFALPWWAYSFPIAAISIATMIMYEKVGGEWFEDLSIVLYAVLVVLLATLVYKTVVAMLAKKICVPE
jgi:tellurite resistance protein